MRRAAEGCPSHDAPSVKEGGLCSCTPLTVPPPISVQRMIRDATGNTKYEFGDGSKALADGSKDAAEKAREAVVAMAHTVGIGQRTYARACEYELPRPCSVPPRPFTHPPTRTHQAAVAVLDAGGTAVEAGAAAKKVLDDSGYQFGDLTKGAIKGWEEIVRDASGNDEYKFGDVTKNAMKGLFGFMEKGAAAAKQKLEDADEK